MRRRRGRRVPTLAILLVLGAGGISEAQELRRDVMANGVLIGAGTGAAAGAVLSLATEDICSPGVCAYLGGVAGGLIGLLVDKQIGHPRPVEPGSLVDDGLGNGALFGALSGAGIALIEVSIRCRPGPGRPPCTRNGILIDMYGSARWMAIVGLLIDAARPSRLPGPPQSPPGAAAERSQRRVGIAVNVRF